MKTVAILQPSYLPWCGYFEQMARADLFVHFDDVPFTRKDWRSRNRILLNGQAHWLSVPVEKRPLGTPILEMTIDYQRDWVRKHRLSIENAYRRAPHYELVAEAVFPVLEAKPERLVDLDLALVERLRPLLDVTTPVVRSSELAFEHDGKSDRVLQLCRQVNADLLYDGLAAESFIDVPQFEAHGISVEFQRYEHPEYPQPVEPFVSHLSVIDLIARLGIEAGAVMRSGAAS